MGPSKLYPAPLSTSAQWCWKFLSWSFCSSQDACQGLLPPPTIEPKASHPCCNYWQIHGSREQGRCKVNAGSASQCLYHTSVHPTRRRKAPGQRLTSLGPQCPTRACVGEALKPSKQSVSGSVPATAGTSSCTFHPMDQEEYSLVVLN